MTLTLAGSLMLGCDFCDSWFHPACLQARMPWVRVRVRVRVRVGVRVGVRVRLGVRVRVRVKVRAMVGYLLVPPGVPAGALPRLSLPLIPYPYSHPYP